MPLVRTALMATAACLIGATAYAQTDNSSQAPQQPPPQSSMPADQSAAPADQGAAAPADAPTAGANASATVDSGGNQVIASQPVPDTKANRTAYGAPLSRAGKRTAPAGN
jgi:hypothetical protein